MRSAALCLILWCTFAPRALAQAGATHQHDAAATAPGWQWSVEGTMFAGYNYQLREFTDFDEFESQNWLMTSLAKTFNSESRLRIDAMFSLEPFTLRDIGSPQVFQTGETFKGAARCLWVAVRAIEIADTP